MTADQASRPRSDLSGHRTRLLLGAMICVAAAAGLLGLALKPRLPTPTETVGTPTNAPKANPSESLNPPTDDALIELGRINPDRPDWGALRKALRSRRATDRLRALEALGKLKQRQALVFAIQGLRDSELAVRLQAARAVEDLWGRRLEESALTKPKEAAAIADELEAEIQSEMGKSLTELRLAELQKRAGQ